MQREETAHGSHAGGEGLGRARRPPRRGRARPALHRPPPRARGHQPAGLRRPPRSPAAPSVGPTSPWPPRTTTSPPTCCAARSPTRSAAIQVDTLRKNCEEFGIRLHSMGDAGQGIVHVIGPQLGITQPGMTIVCGDSHTSTHGAFGALAFGIGTSEVEHVLATQTLPLPAPEDDGRHRRGRPARRAPRPRTSCSHSSPRSAPAADRGTSWSTAVQPSARCPWRAA